MKWDEMRCSPRAAAHSDGVDVRHMPDIRDELVEMREFLVDLRTDFRSLTQ